jgi:hypothetical protein
MIDDAMVLVVGFAVVFVVVVFVVVDLELLDCQCLPGPIQNRMSQRGSFDEVKMMA